MKKFGIFSVILIATILLGCGNSSETKAQTSEESSKKEAVMEKQDSSKPEKLTKEAFLKKVMDFEKNPKEWVFEGDLPCVIDFYADWCKPCKMVAPIMDELAKKYEGKVNIYKVDTQNEKELAQAFMIRSIPAVLFCPKEGKPMMQTGALSKETYIKIIEDNLLKPQENK